MTSPSHKNHSRGGTVHHHLITGDNPSGVGIGLFCR